MVELKPSTIRKIVELVDTRGGVTVFSNAYIRKCEGKQRFTTERMYAMTRAIRAQGLLMYPSVGPGGPDEWIQFAVYRPEMTLVQVSKLSEEGRKNLAVINEHLSKPYWKQSVYDRVFVNALRALDAECSSVRTPARRLTVA